MNDEEILRIILFISFCKKIRMDGKKNVNDMVKKRQNHICAYFLLKLFLLCFIYNQCLFQLICVARITTLRRHEIEIGLVN